MLGCPLFVHSMSAPRSLLRSTSEFYMYNHINMYMYYIYMGICKFINTSMCMCCSFLSEKYPLEKEVRIRSPTSWLQHPISPVSYGHQTALTAAYAIDVLISGANSRLNELEWEFSVHLQPDNNRCAEVIMFDWIRDKNRLWLLKKYSIIILIIIIIIINSLFRKTYILHI